MDEREVSGYFDEKTDIYSNDRQTRYIESWTRVDDILSEIVPPGGKVLDIGCGDGKLLEYSLRNTAMGSGVGIDFSRGMLPENSSDEIEFILGTATDLPLKESSFDVVHLANLLHHVVGRSRSESKQKATEVIEFAMQLSAPDGKILITEHFHEGPIGRSAVTPNLIYFGLDRLAPIAKLVDPEVHDGLLVSFYTRGELEQIVAGAGGVVESKIVEFEDKETILRKVLESKLGRIHMVVGHNAAE